MTTGGSRRWSGVASSTLTTDVRRMVALSGVVVASTDGRAGKDDVGLFPEDGKWFDDGGVF